MLACSPPDCSWFLGDETALPPALEPIPDISSIGVLVGFVGTAYLTLLLLLANYLLVFIANDQDGSLHVNPVDQVFVGWVRRKVRISSRSLDWQRRWEETIKKCVLSLSDQQIVTGLAILASGYSQLACGLSAYHWQIVIHLAWFASLTHLTTLTILRPYLQKHYILLLLRLLFMAALLILLGYGLLPTGNSRWLVDSYNWTPFQPGIPAQCFYKELFAHDGYVPRSIQFPSMLMSIFVLTSSYLIRVIKLSQTGSQRTRKYIRLKPGVWWKKRLHQRVILYSQTSTTTERLKLLFCPVEVTVFVILMAVFDIAESTLWEIMCLIYALLWGTVNLILTRASISNYGTSGSYPVREAEEFWGFGQLIAVLLLLLPLLTLGEACYETFSNSNLEQRTPSVDWASIPRSSSHSSLAGLARPSSLLVHPRDSVFPMQAISRIGTDLAHEEQSIGLLPNARSQDGLVAANPCFFEGGTFYSYTWFRELLILLLVIAIEMAISFLMVSKLIYGGDLVTIIFNKILNGPISFFMVFSSVFWNVFFEGDMQPNHQLVKKDRRYRKTRTPIGLVIWVPRCIGVTLCTVNILSSLGMNGLFEYLKTD